MPVSKQADLPLLRRRLDAAVRTVPDFPQPGISFKDITPVLADPELLDDCAGALAEFGATMAPQLDFVAGIEARGFIFGALAAQRLGCGFIPIRKPGKLPSDTLAVEYELEYGTGTLEIHRDAAAAGQTVLLVDDLLATGGTAEASVSLLRQTGAEVVGSAFVIQLSYLYSSTTLAGTDIFSILHYD